VGGIGINECCIFVCMLNRMNRGEGFLCLMIVFFCSTFLVLISIISRESANYFSFELNDSD